VTDYTDNYERFWKAYPKRNGRKVGKFDAFKVWKTMSADDKRAAFTEIEKRNRQQSHGKYIKDALRYLKGRGWEDDVEADQKDMLGNRPMPEAKEAEVELPWPERMFNRLFKSYVFGAMGLPDVTRALKVKHDMLANEVPVMLDDDSEPLGQRAATLAELFLLRLDQAYGLSLKNRILRLARKL